MNKKNNKIFSPVRNQKFLNGVRNDFLSGANGVKNIFRFLPKDYLKFLGRKIMTTVILTVTVMITAGLAIWALAAFTEPVVGPAGSDQDYAQNILGANNADNDFDSSLVTASSTGSLIERLQYIWDNRASFMANVTNLDATVSSRLAAASYVTERGTDNAALDSEVGNSSDAASMSTTLFAGQQYIADNTGKVVWAGYTSAGGLTTTGTKGMNNSCNTAYSGSHACSYNDIIRLGNSYPYSANAWVIDGGITINDAGTMSQPSFAFAFSILLLLLLFFVFWLAFHRLHFIGMFVATGGSLRLAACDSPYNLPCCK